MSLQQITPTTSETSIPYPLHFDESCAWCWGEIGQRPQSGSHGCCPRHEAEMYAQIDQVREERAARKAHKS